MRQKLWKLPNFKIKPFLRKLKDDPRCQCESVESALEYISVMLNMDQESRDNDGNKSDMRPASKFRGRGIKFHHLQPHIFLSFYVKHSRQVKHDSILLQIDPKYWVVQQLEGVGKDLILSPNERKQISFGFVNPSMGEEGAGK